MPHRSLFNAVALNWSFPNTFFPFNSHPFLITLDANCRLINKSFSRSSVCQLPERTYIETFSSLPPRFIAEPSSQIAGRTDDYITFECAVSYVSDYQPNFTWEHNGREIKNNYSNEGNSSILRVRNTRSAEGAYRCIVHSEQLKYNMTSRYGYLQIGESHTGLSKKM